MPPDQTVAIETQQLTKSYGDKTAVNGVDLQVPAGVVFGVLGPNGAGKTTMIRILTTLLRPTSGVARVFGHDVTTESDAVRRQISVTGQYASVDEGLTGVENLVLIGRLYGYSWKQARDRADELIEAFDLVDAGTQMLRTYSGGMRRRLDIAASVVVTPKLLFLDEPTTGLDPRSRAQVWQIVRTLVRTGTTILLTTQYLEEADHLADRIAVVDRGQIIADGTTGELKASTSTRVLHVRLDNPSDRDMAKQLLAERLGAEVHCENDPSSLTVPVTDSTSVTGALNALSSTGINFEDFNLGQPSLDEVFLSLTGHDTKIQDKDAA